ncbi:hypothetical protein [Paenibacillus hexagrammi]|uniref:DUF1832 domain-containing protein n=1 Tax=Paenibacillus hexagrammi TaxID=2908839 RepID=A0ABY3SHG9_9BACL|nr:hypothetical protein [Paenibacillus sp. YPD9-1]UJF32661.1 hypothetical protein L0M14_24030 [Paenibacillus sp. YPD9-1]
MSGKRMVLSAYGKQILDNFAAYLSMSRPQVLKLAFARGFTSDYDTHPIGTLTEKGWEIPDVFSEEDLLLFKHLIINKCKKDIDSSELSQEMLKSIESGLLMFEKLYNERNSLDDLKMLLLS